MKQLYELSRKFPKEWIKKAPKGKFGNYVPHPVITQRLLEASNRNETFHITREHCITDMVCVFRWAEVLCVPQLVT